MDGSEKLKSVDAALRGAKNQAESTLFTFRNLSRAFLALRAIGAVKNFVGGLITQADQLQHNAEMLGINTEELQKFQYVSGLMQVPVQQTVISLRFFNRAIGEAAFGTKQAVAIFARLGISIKDANGEIKPTDELLFEVADKLKGIRSQAERTAIAMRLLGRNGAAMLPVLQNGGEALRQAFKDVEELGGGFNDEFIEAAHKTDVQLKRLKMGWRSVAVAIATEVLPWLNKNIEASIRTVKHLIDLAKHTYFFRTALATLAGGALFFALYRLFKLFGIGRMSVRDLLAAFIKYPVIMLVTAAIVGLYLAFDDLYTFLKGGKSVIGDWLDHFGGIGTAAASAADLSKALGDVWDALKPIGEALKPIAKDMFRAFVDSIPAIIRWGGQFSLWVVKLIDMAVSGLSEMGTLLIGLFKAAGHLGAGDTAGAGKALEDAWNQVVNNNAAAAGRWTKYDKAMDAFDALGHPKPGAAPGSDYGPPAPRPMETTGTGTRVTVNANITNNITGATDPKATATAVGKATKQGIEGAVNRKAFNALTAGQPVTGQ